MKKENKKGKRHIRHKRIRAKIFGTKETPRLCVFSSNKHIYAQLINDEKSKTMVSASDLETKKTKDKGKLAVSRQVGKLIAEKAKELKITRIIFDRGGYKYHGRIKALADGAREGGLNF